MGHFTDASPDDPLGQFDALRRMIADTRALALPPDTARRAEMRANAEQVFGSPLGIETGAFLDLLADALAADAFEAFCGDAGKVEAHEACAYRAALVDVSTLEPTLSGLSFMQTADFESHFVIATEDQGALRCGCVVYEKRDDRGHVSLRATMHSDATLLCFALRFWGLKPAPGSLLFGLEAEDHDEFLREAETCLGPPADLGGGVLLFEHPAARVLSTPDSWTPIHLDLRDAGDLGPVSDAFLGQLFLTREGIARMAAKDEAAGR
jgi:hypothetical protein